MNELTLRRGGASAPAREVENLGKIGDVFLHEVPELADCDVGIDEVVEYNLIIAPAEMPKKIGSIHIADETRETLGLARQVGRIVLQSEIAFNYDVWPADGKGPPKVGDIVWFARYAGGLITGRDGKEYRIIKDKDIAAIITRAPRPTADLHDFGGGATCVNCGATHEEARDYLAPECDPTKVQAARDRHAADRDLRKQGISPNRADRALNGEQGE